MIYRVRMPYATQKKNGSKSQSNGLIGLSMPFDPGIP
jgi:hypothetical protein